MTWNMRKGRIRCCTILVNGLKASMSYEKFFTHNWVEKMKEFFGSPQKISKAYVNGIEEPILYNSRSDDEVNFVSDDGVTIRGNALIMKLVESEGVLIPQNILRKTIEEYMEILNSRLADNSYRRAGKLKGWGGSYNGSYYR